MEKTAMQFAIEWVNDNYPKFNHYEIEAKLTELRDTVEKEQTNTLQSENDRLRERVRELEEVVTEFIKSYEREYPTATSENYIPEYSKAKDLLIKPDSTGGGEKEGCAKND